MSNSPYNITISSSEYALLLDMERERNEALEQNAKLKEENTKLINVIQKELKDNSHALWKITEFLRPVKEEYKECIIVAFGTLNKLTSKEEWSVKIDCLVEHDVFNTSEEAISHAKNIIDSEFK